MKMKQFILALLLLISAGAQANICNQARMHLIGGTDFYKNFLVSLDEIKQDYTYVYHKVDDVLEKDIKHSCRGRKKSTVRMERNHVQLCLNTCASVASDFHTRILKTRFFKGSKIKQMTRECQSICKMDFNCEADALCANGL